MAIGGAIVGRDRRSCLPEVWGNGFEATNRILRGNPTLALPRPPLRRERSSRRRRRSGRAASAASSRRRSSSAPRSAAWSPRSSHVALPRPRGARRRLRAARHGRAARRRDAGAAARRDHDLRADAEHRGPAPDDGRLGPRGRCRRGSSRRTRSTSQSLRSAGIVWEKTPEATAISTLRVSDIMRTRRRARSRGRRRCPRSSNAFLTHAQPLSLRRRRGGQARWASWTSTTSRRRSPSASSRGLVIAEDLVTEIPCVTPEEPLTSVNEKLWFRDLGQLPVVDSLDRRVPRHRDAAGPARRDRPRGPAAEPPGRARATSARRAGRLLELPEKHRLIEVDVPASREGPRSRRRTCGPVTAYPCSP